MYIFPVLWISRIAPAIPTHGIEQRCPEYEHTSATLLTCIQLVCHMCARHMWCQLCAVNMMCSKPSLNSTSSQDTSITVVADLVKQDHMQWKTSGS